MGLNGDKATLELIGDSKEYFRQSLHEALTERKVETYPVVESYLVEILEHYLFTENLFDEERSTGRRSRETLAETMLKAATATPRVRFDLLKRLGDGALYVSGFFGDSLQRKIVDVDYYIDMGSTAYLSLSQVVYEDTFSQLYKEIAIKFNEFVDVFSLMSRKSMNSEDNILRLMELYAKTESPLARERLAEKGLFPNPHHLKVTKNQ
jgi:hypothetical protein